MDEGCPYTYSRCVQGPWILEASRRLALYPESAAQFVNWLDIRPGDHFLEVGCGTGAVCRWLAQAGSFRGIGLEKDRRLVHAARRLARSAGLTNRLSFVEGDACRLPFPDNSFDACFAFALLHYACGDARKILIEMVRVVKPASTIATVHPIDECPLPPQGENGALSSEIAELESILFDCTDKLIAYRLKDYRQMCWRDAAATLEEITGSRVRLRGFFFPTYPEELASDEYARYLERQRRELVRRAQFIARLAAGTESKGRSTVEGYVGRLVSLYAPRAEFMQAQHRAGTRNYCWIAPPRLVIIARKV